MPVLTKKLKEEHKSILTLIDEIDSMDIMSLSAKAKIEELEKALSAHLLKEDEWLYPSLKNEAKTNEKIKFSLDLFASHSSMLSREILKFFELYRLAPDTIAVDKQFSILKSSLLMRMRREELVLFAEYDRIKSKNITASQEA